MYIGRLKNNFASVLAFGHVKGFGQSRHKFIRAITKPVTIDEPTMTAEDMGITFQSAPELYRAINPLFGGRQYKETWGA